MQVMFFIPMAVALALTGYFVLATDEGPKWKATAIGVLVFSLLMQHVVSFTGSWETGVAMQSLLAIVLLLYFKVK